jgi:ribosomal protein S18 acetylase RimI-like enzyme
MVEAWQAAFAGGPNFVHVTEGDLLGRVIEQPSFEQTRLLAAVEGAEVAGFVHFGPRSGLWYHLQDRAADRREGQVYVLAARRGEVELMRLLLRTAVDSLREAGAGRVQLGPSWIHGTQPFYNGIAGGYEIPGWSSTEQELLQVAGEQGFVEETGYGTPELDLGDRGHVAALRAHGETLMEMARGCGLRQGMVVLQPWFFPGRQAVVLRDDHDTVAMTVYGPWEEYAREYGKRVFGITSVQVAEAWRGRGLGKLVMILAMEAAMQAGAEALHLHVWEGNKPAWNLYHQALGFQPKWRWVTLAAALG